MSNEAAAAAALVGKLETELAGKPKTFDKYGQLVDNCVRSNAKPRALACVELGKAFMASNEMSIERKYEFALSLVSVWKMERFSKKAKDVIRINISPERKQILRDAHDILQSLPPSDDEQLQHRIMLTFAFVKESLGLLSESLAILSDLITAEADESVELAYIIFKAAVILKRLGQSGQALEYLEFLQDDPPSRSHVTRAHVLALLTLTFDQGGSKYAVVLQQTYPQLQAAYLEDIRNGPNPEATLVRAEKVFQQRPIEKSADVWEVLALQMLERSETAFCAELFHQATLKAPNKASVLHTCSEITYVLNDVPRALKYAERAYHMQPQNGDLRNFLLVMDPDAWADKLRTALPVHNTSVSAEEEAKRLAAMGAMKSKVKKKEDKDDAPAEEDAWLASGHLKPVAKKKKDGADKVSDEKTGDKKQGKSAVGAKKVAKKKKKEGEDTATVTAVADGKVVKKKKKKSVGGDASVAGEEEGRGAKELDEWEGQGARKQKDKKESIRGEEEQGAGNDFNNKSETSRGRPERPAEAVEDGEVQKYIRFAVFGNDDVHMYDENLSALRDLRASAK